MAMDDFMHWSQNANNTKMGKGRVLPNFEQAYMLCSSGTSAGQRTSVTAKRRPVLFHAVIANGLMTGNE